MTLTATHINYFHVCSRKLWLFAHGIRMEHTSESVYDGKLLHENSYPQRAGKYSEIEFSALYQNSLQLTGKIDFYDPRQKIIHETKRSDKIEDAHQWQIKFYIWLLELNGIEGVRGLLEYPKLRQSSEVLLNSKDKSYLQQIIYNIEQLLLREECPEKINSKICKSCSYYELCYVEEV